MTTKKIHILANAAALALVAACQRPPPPPAPLPTPVLAPTPAIPDTVWTREVGAVLRRDGGAVALPRPLTRLEVIRGDSASLLVRCGLCQDTVPGWIGRGEVLHETARPHDAATRSLAEFALAVRTAAAGHDLTELRPVMAMDFSFSAIGSYGRDLALRSWEWERHRTLDEAVRLIDGGLVPYRDWWVAPADFATRHDYRGLRLGFRQDAQGRWEWVFLMRGEAG